MTAAILNTCKHKPPPPPFPHVYVQYCDSEADRFVHLVAKGVFTEEALPDAARQFKQQPEKVEGRRGRVAALEFPRIVRHVLKCTPAQELSVSGCQALQLPTSSIPSCFTNLGEVSLVAVVGLDLTGAPANFHLIEISKLPV